MTEPIDRQRIAATNPAVDLRKLEQVEQVNRVLESAGILKRAEYRVSHPMGNEPKNKLVPEGLVRMTRGAHR